MAGPCDIGYIVFLMVKNSRRTLKILASASFLNDMGSDMIYPVWPLFVTTIMGANMSLLGLIDGIGDALVSIAQAVSGYVSDRIRKRKVFVYFGYLMGGISRLGYAFSSSWQHLLLFKAFDRAGKIRGAPRDAIIADISTKKNRGTNFGFLRALDNLGAVCGILICLVLFGHLGYRNLFLLAAIPSLAGAFLVFSLIRERRSVARIYKGVSFRDMKTGLKMLFLANAIFAIGAFSYSFLLVFANKSGFEAGFAPLLYLIFTIFAFLSSIPFGRLSDRIGRKPVLAISYALWIATCSAFIFFSSPLVILMAFVSYGLHKGAFETVQRAYVAELAPENFRASILGGFQMVIGLCALPASVLAGLLWDNFGMNMPFLLSIVTSMTAIFLLALVNNK